ncbi:MAG: hypothetical protein RBR81_03455 [Bacteroidales bacterium]|jgi:hypothetical protein|nr:hypothetical protein [Bacteroidales bacterium]
MENPRVLIGAIAYLIVVIIGVVIFLQGRKNEKKQGIDREMETVD